MKYQMTMTVESREFQPDVNVVWPASEVLGKKLIEDVTITHLSVCNLEPPDILVPVSTTVAMMKGNHQSPINRGNSDAI